MLLRKSFYISLLFTLCVGFTTKAQMIDYIHAYIGTSMYPTNLQLNTQGIPTNIYAGYTPAQIVGGALFRQVTDKVCIGAGAEISNTFKPNYHLFINTINTYAKYNFNNIERFISPYVIGGLNMSFISLKQEQFTAPYIPTDNDPNSPSTINLQITDRQNYVNMMFVPMYGAHIGAGLEFKITEGWGLYGQYMFNYTFAKNSLIQKQDNYKQNEYNLMYQSFVGGIRFYL